MGHALIACSRLPISKYADHLSASLPPPFERLATGQGYRRAEVPRWPHHPSSAVGVLWCCSWGAVLVAQLSSSLLKGSYAPVAVRGCGCSPAWGARAGAVRLWRGAGLAPAPRAQAPLWVMLLLPVPQRAVPRALRHSLLCCAEHLEHRRGEPVLHLSPETFSPERTMKQLSICHCLMCSILTDSSSSVAAEPSSLCFSLLCFTCLAISVLCHLVLQSCCLFCFLAIYLLLISLPLIHICVQLIFK